MRLPTSSSSTFVYDNRGNLTAADTTYDYGSRRHR